MANGVLDATSSRTAISRSPKPAIVSSRNEAREALSRAIRPAGTLRHLHAAAGAQRRIFTGNVARACNAGSADLAAARSGHMRSECV